MQLLSKFIENSPELCESKHALAVKMLLEGDKHTVIHILTW